MPELLHRNIFIPGPAGRLEALLWSVAENPGGVPPLAALVCHPHPLFGGTMHNKVVYQTAKTLHRFGLPVLRFNFRGVGASEGTHDKGRGEVEDAAAALDFLSGEYPGARLLSAGFSFGSWVGLRAGCGDPRVAELIGLGLPVDDLGDREFSYLSACAKPKLLVNGEFDMYGPPRKLRAMAEAFPAHVKEQTSVAVISGADHFFAGHLAELEKTIADWLTARHPDLIASVE
jgi:alpha/beta superfamily hydrolase